MYSGSTMHRFSGNLLGAHQKIDRLARHQLDRLMPKSRFPASRAILHFEGNNGPDGIKRKSPAVNEPWHYLQPFDKHDNQLIELIEAHYLKLVEALRVKDSVRASFEAAWLSHAIVDGLTPAHHYPYEEKLLELRAGQGLDSRTTVIQKAIFPGAGLRDKAKNNWKFWGPKGLFTTHFTFEWGVAMLLAPLRMRRRLPSIEKVVEFETQPIGKWFRRLAQDVARLELYDAFCKTGWTIPLARRVRQQLAPTLVEAVAVIWYSAAREAGLVEA